MDLNYLNYQKTDRLQYYLQCSAASGMGINEGREKGI